jgi:hypothetical protein
MHEAIVSPLEAWGSFYVIAGSSAGALTGLQFIVLTLVGQSQLTRGRGESISAFGTPNVVHFCAALLVASILTVPWNALRPAGFAVASCGALGVVYSTIVLRRARTSPFSRTGYGTPSCRRSRIRHCWWPARFSGGIPRTHCSSSAPPCCCSCSSGSTTRGTR